MRFAIVSHPQLNTWNSGESGAGKTESAKFVINYIIEHCRHRHDNSQGSKMHAVANLEEQILQVNPLLEAFGAVLH